MAKTIITTKIEVDVLELVDSASEWEALSSEQQAEIASDYFDEHPNEGWDFDVHGDWDDGELEEEGDL